MLFQLHNPILTHVLLLWKQTGAWNCHATRGHRKTTIFTSLFCASWVRRWYSSPPPTCREKCDNSASLTRANHPTMSHAATAYTALSTTCIMYLRERAARRTSTSLISHHTHWWGGVSTSSCEWQKRADFLTWLFFSQSFSHFDAERFSHS